MLRPALECRAGAVVLGALVTERPSPLKLQSYSSRSCERALGTDLRRGFRLPIGLAPSLGELEQKGLEKGNGT